MGCKLQALPINYLELPLNFKKVSYNDWATVIDKLTSRLECWNSKYLLLGGRITFLNLVLSAIPTYYLVVLHCPVRIEHEIDKIRRRFLWTSNSFGGRGYHLAKWQAVCRSKKQDGRGILNIRNFNIGLKCKLL